MPASRSGMGAAGARASPNAATRATDDDERARRTALADEVKTEIEQALARSQVVVVRRATNAVSGFWAWLLYALVLGERVVFAVGTDKVTSDRTGRHAPRFCTSQTTPTAGR